MSGQPVGARLIRWVIRCCDQHDVDSVLLPMIADMQFEELASSRRSRFIRAWVRIRGCVNFWRALTVVTTRRCGKNALKSDPVGFLRVLMAAPAALVAAGLFQGTAGLGLGAPIYYATQSVWMVKVLVAPLAAAIFLWTMCLVAPRHRRRAVAVAALIVIAFWGGLLIFGGVSSATGFNGWLFSMGAAGWIGGGVAGATALRRFDAVASAAREAE